MRRRQNFAFFPPFFFRFSPLVIFLFCWALIGFISVGKVFGKAFRILGLDERKGKWVVEQDFYGNFRVNVAWFLAFFSCLLDQLMLILVWFKRTSSPCTSQLTKLSLYLKTDGVKSGKRELDSHRRLGAIQGRMS